jgi:hypothetical protein
MFLSASPVCASCGAASFWAYWPSGRDFLSDRDRRPDDWGRVMTESTITRRRTKRNDAPLPPKPTLL